MARPAPVDDQGDDRLEVGPPKQVAAGLTGVGVALAHTVHEAGIRRGVKALRLLNQERGFDCPGCAWPDPTDRSAFEFCENGAKAVAEEATLRRVGPEFFATHSIDDLRSRSDHWLGKQGRLTSPMIKGPGDSHYRPIGWNDAFGIVASALADSGDPDRAVFYTSGRTSNEAAFLYQLFVRMLGTNNLPDCSNMCHESSGVALTETVGLGKGTVSLSDIGEADLLVIVGQNPGTNHPRMLTTLEAAKANGARIIAINPLPEAGLIRFRNPQRPSGVVGRGTALADLFLQVKVGSDLALFTLLNRWLIDADEVDHQFVDRHCDGLDELVAHLQATDVDGLVAATGLPITELREAFEMLVASERTIVCWAMGLTQHRSAVATIREIANTVLLRGSIGRPGAGLCPVRGHSNVQGDRTMGIYEKPAAAFLDRLDAEFGIRAPREPGHDTVDAIRAMQRGEVDVFFAMGGNFLSAAPDTAATAQALAGCKLTVHVSTKPNRSHVTCGETAIILPTLGRTDEDLTGGRAQAVTVEDSMSMVHLSHGSLDPPSADLRSEVAIVCGLARAVLGADSGVDWSALASDYDRIRDHIEAVIPGFERFNERVREPGGFELAHPARVREFTGDGIAHLTVNPYVAIEVPIGRLLLQTIRSHDQFNTTIYGLDDRYRGISQGRHVVLVNPADLKGLALGDGEIVDVI
ncbi:MAG: FdhF/YdeP family oxidoreductase, partial [Acidimicrobiales bacterium]